MMKFLVGLVLGFFLAAAIYRPVQTKLLFDKLVDTIHKNAAPAQVKKVADTVWMPPLPGEHQRDYIYDEPSAFSASY